MLLSAAPPARGRLRIPSIVPWAALALLAPALAGCDLLPGEAPAEAIYQPRLYAVTVPESLVAGQYVTLYAHCQLGCGDLESWMEGISGPPGRIVLTVHTRRRLNVLCPAELRPDQTIVRQRLRVPSSGALTVVVEGAGESIAVPLAPRAPAAGAVHTIEFLRAGTLEPATDIAGYVGTGDLGLDTLTTFRVDAAGRALLSYRCDSTERSFEIFYDGGGVAFPNWVYFAPVDEFSGRALRTTAVVGARTGEFRALQSPQPRPPRGGS